MLSTLGWVRQARGHDVDPDQLSYKTGDAFQAAARGRSTQQAVFIDSTGRAYSLPAHTLPSARGQGEPLSGRLDPPEGATFAAVADRRAGRQVAARLRRRATASSRSSRRSPAGTAPARPCSACRRTRRCCRPRRCPAEEGALVASVNSDGRMLAFPVADLPEMEKGRGNLIFGIPGKKVARAARN